MDIKKRIEYLFKELGFEEGHYKWKYFYDEGEFG